LGTRPAVCHKADEKTNTEERTMLLNDVPENKKLAYLLGRQVERHAFGRRVRLFAVRVMVTMGVGLLLFSLWLAVNFKWR
jgi:hypothetical protein